MIQPCGIHISVLETGQKTQLSLQRNSTFRTTWRLIKACDLRRTWNLKPGFHMIATVAAQRSQRSLRSLRAYGNIHSAIFAIVATVDRNDRRDRNFSISAITVATIAKIAECMFPYARKDRSDRCYRCAAIVVIIWKPGLINELTSRNSGKTYNIFEIKAYNKIVSNPVDTAETINECCTMILRKH